LQEPVVARSVGRSLWKAQPQDRFDESALSAAVGTQDRDDLALFHVKIDAMDDFVRAVA
jgi:hypothetical protein